MREGGGCHVVLAWFRRLRVVLVAAGPLLLWAGCVIVGPVVGDVVPPVMVSLSLSLWFPSRSCPVVSPWVLGRGFVGGFCRSPSANSTPNPPREQSLAAVEVGAGVGCWCSSSPFLCTREPPYEQVLVGMGRVCCSSRPPCPLPRSPDVVRTCKPPHEQWLVGMGRVRCWGPPSPARRRQVAPTIYPTSSCS
jgi:hypothetical protein